MKGAFGLRVAIAMRSTATKAVTVGEVKLTSLSCCFILNLQVRLRLRPRLRERRNHNTSSLTQAWRSSARIVSTRCNASVFLHYLTFLHFSFTPYCIANWIIFIARNAPHALETASTSHSNARTLVARPTVQLACQNHHLPRMSATTAPTADQSLA